MTITRRHALGLLASALHRAQVELPPGIEPDSGHFKGTRESLREYEIPDWFRDAKFGIWAHWGPQSAVEVRRLVRPQHVHAGQPQYDYHCQTYGHPSKFGFKDVIPLEGRELRSRPS